jgi:hypothetical protein
VGFGWEIIYVRGRVWILAVSKKEYAGIWVEKF